MRTTAPDRYAQLAPRCAEPRTVARTRRDQRRNVFLGQVQIIHGSSTAHARRSVRKRTAATLATFGRQIDRLPHRPRRPVDGYYARTGRPVCPLLPAVEA